MNGQINQIIAETHLNSLFSGLATVLPTPCQNKKVCLRGEKERGKSNRDNIIRHTCIQCVFSNVCSHFVLLLVFVFGNKVHP